MQEQMELFTSEWGVRNDVKHLVDPLNDLLPAMGMVKNANKNKWLEKFRKAQNVSYDIFNNGLCNRKAHFRRFFGWAPLGFDFHRSQWERFEEELEPTFTQIMQEAAAEQRKLGNL